jgi:Fic family protein
MNVRVGDYAAPLGGPAIPERLEQIVEAARTTDDPWRVHVNFEMLHPYLDGNGRTGRALWAWHTLRLGRDPFDIPFLHRFYYQTLEHLEHQT